MIPLNTDNLVYDCPLCQKAIGAGLCMDLNLQRTSAVKRDELGVVMKTRNLDISYVNAICDNCVHNPLDAI